MVKVESGKFAESDDLKHVSDCSDVDASHYV